MSATSQGPSVTPDPILKLGTGFMAAKHLFAAVELGVFEKLGEPRTLDELTAALGIPRRTARISVDAMVAVGLVRREGDRYVNGPEAQTFLSGQGPADLRPWARFWNRISYGAWQGLEDALLELYEESDKGSEQRAICLDAWDTLLERGSSWYHRNLERFDS